MRNPDFPNWKHILAMAGIYFAGSMIAGIPLAIVMMFDLIGGGMENLDFESLAMADPETVVDPRWISHFAPFMGAFPLILASLYGWQRLGKPKIRFGFGNVSPATGLLSVLGTLLIANGVTIIAEFLPGYDSFVKAMEQMLVPGIGMAIAIIIGAPLFEELLFRGIILRGYLRKRKPWVGILFSGLLFGALHILPVHVFFASIVGIALGYVYYRTRSLGLVILIHFINNGLSYLLSQLGYSGTTTEMTGLGTGSVVGLSVLLTALGVGALYLLERFPLVPAPPEDQPEAAPDTSEALANRSAA